MSKQLWTRRTWTSEFQGYHILLWSMRKVPAFENWFRKLRTTQIDTLFNKIYDKIKQNTHLVQNQRKWCRKWATSNLFELLETDPKTQCTACLSYWNVGIVYCTCGHFLQKETEANRHFVKYTMDLLSLPAYVIKKGRPHGHRFWKKPGDK